MAATDPTSVTAAALARTRYPETWQLWQVAGVGPLTVLCYGPSIEDPNRTIGKP